MDFLDTHGTVMRHTKMDILIAQQAGHTAAFLAGKGDDMHLAFMGGADRLDHVGRIATGGEGDQHVARLTQRLYLAFKYIVETVVIADGSKDRGVGVQRNAGKRDAVAFEPADQLGDEMLGIGSRAAIAAGEHFTIIADGVDQHIDGDSQRFGQHLVALGDDAGRIIEMKRNTGRDVHIDIIARVKKNRMGSCCYASRQRAAKGAFEASAKPIVTVLWSSEDGR